MGKLKWFCNINKFVEKCDVFITDGKLLRNLGYPCYSVSKKSIQANSENLLHTIFCFLRLLRKHAIFGLCPKILQSQKSVQQGFSEFAYGVINMLALGLNTDEVKNFMKILLRENIFDGFEARLVEIDTTVRVSIDGANETGEFSAWETVRPLVFEIVKLSAKPRRMKVVFSHKNTEEIHANAAALFLNIVYENDGITFTTGAAQREFAMDKTHDTEWDAWVRGFFAKTGIHAMDRE